MTILISIPAVRMIFSIYQMTFYLLPPDDEDPPELERDEPEELEEPDEYELLEPEDLEPEEYDEDDDLLVELEDE